MGVDARNTNFEIITLFGKEMLFTCARVDRDTVPKGMYAYDVRDGGCDGNPCEIAKYVIVNHWGTVITNRPIKLEQPNPNWNPFRLIDCKKEWDYEGINSTLQEYMKRYPPVISKENTR